LGLGVLGFALFLFGVNLLIFSQVAPYVLAFYGGRGAGMVLVWPFLYAWHEGYANGLAYSVVCLSGMGVAYCASLASALVFLGPQRLLRFPNALAIALSLGGAAMLLVLEPFAFFFGLPLIGFFSLWSFRRHFKLDLGNALLGWGAVTALFLLVAFLSPVRKDLFSASELHFQVTRPRAERHRTPREQAEKAAEIARLRAHPYVEPQSTKYYVNDKSLPGEVRFLIAKEKSGYDPESMFLLGNCYNEGLGIPRDPEQARLWWQRAIARSGHSDAKLALGQALMEGKGLPCDPEGGRELIGSVIRWYRNIPQSLIKDLEARGLARELPEWNSKYWSLSVVPGHGAYSSEDKRQRLEELKRASQADPAYWPYLELVRGWEELFDREAQAQSEAALQAGTPTFAPGMSKPSGGVLPAEQPARPPLSKAELITLFRKQSRRRLHPDELEMIQNEEPMAQAELGWREWEGQGLAKAPSTAVRHLESGMNRASKSQRLQRWWVSLKACEALAQAFGSGVGTPVDSGKAKAWRDAGEWVKREHYGIPHDSPQR
jgi:TPR repeat protein